MKTRSVTTKMLLATIAAVLPLALGLLIVISYSMNGLTDSVMLGMMQPMAKTASQNVENRMHLLAERFFLLRENRIFRDTGTSVSQKQESLDIARAGREYAWLALYEPDGALLTGSEPSPRTIAGRELFPLLKETKNLVIEKTSIGTLGPEIVMGLPVFAVRAPGEGAATKVAYYLVGSYKYDVLSDVLRDINIGTGGTAFIMDRNGTVIAHKNLGKVFSQQSMKRDLGEGVEVDALFTAMLQNQTGSARLWSGGRDLFVGFSPIKGTLWTLVVQAPRDDFMGSAHRALLIGGGHYRGRALEHASVRRRF